MAKKGAAAGTAGETQNAGEMPNAIKMLAPHGFIDDNDVHQYWQQDQVVTDPAHIALLTERGASFVQVETAKPEA